MGQLELAFAVAAAPLSIDRLVDWGIARPTELWAFLDDARARGWVAEDEIAGKGHFVLRDRARRIEILEAASEADLAALAGHRELRADLLSTARWLRGERRFVPAVGILTVLVARVPPAEFPDGPRGWMAALLESIRTFRRMYGVDPKLLERAVAVAEAQGDIDSQAVFLAATSYAALMSGRLDEARAAGARATELARSASRPVQLETATYQAGTFFWQGRAREAVEAFEAMLGDVPDDVLETVLTMPENVSPAAAAPFTMMGLAYGYTGHFAQAVELLHRVLARGESLGRPEIVAEAQLFLGFAHVNERSLAGREHVEYAWRAYGARPTEPFYAYMSALAMAWVHAAEGNLDEMRRAFAECLVARRRAGSPPFAGYLPFQIEELTGPAAFEAIEGLDLVAEAKRTAAGTNVLAAGSAERFLARHAEREPAGAERDSRIAAHLDRAIALLRESGALPELGRALADAAARAESAGDAGRARACRDELRKLRASLPEGPRQDAVGRQARLAAVILGLGRLTALRERQEGFWGEIALRLGQGLGAERIALVEAGPPPRLLAVRGGDASWQRAAGDLAATGEREVAFTTMPSGARRLVVPFTAEGLGRGGIVVLENEHAPALVGPGDGPLLEALGVQIGVLYGNVLMWKELAAARERLEQENRYFRDARPAAAAGRIVAHSPAMTEVLDLVARVAPTTSSVLVLGETGVGKELVALEVHRQSRRSSAPFIAVHIAALAPGLVASGLFGHERGAFTGATEQQRGRFELADGGTIFLDEIGELPADEQVRLLRVLQEGTFERVGGHRPIRSDFRLVAATNRDLEREVKAGRFREDLWFRLAVFPIRVPPLRERREEIPTLALLFMERFARNLGRSFDGISEADMERLVGYAWPGNVRELEHLVERAVLLSDGPRLRIPPLAAPGAPAPEAREGDGLVTAREAERRHVARVLEHTHGRVTGAGGAAEILDLKPSTLNWRIKELGLRDVLERAREKGPERRSG